MTKIQALLLLFHPRLMSLWMQLWWHWAVAQVSTVYTRKPCGSPLQRWLKVVRGVVFKKTSCNPTCKKRCISRLWQKSLGYLERTRVPIRPSYRLLQKELTPGHGSQVNVLSQQRAGQQAAAGSGLEYETPWVFAQMPAHRFCFSSSARSCPSLRWSWLMASSPKPQRTVLRLGVYSQLPAPPHVGPKPTAWRGHTRPRLLYLTAARRSPRSCSPEFSARAGWGYDCIKISRHLLLCPSLF